MNPIEIVGARYIVPAMQRIDARNAINAAHRTRWGGRGFIDYAVGTRKGRVYTRLIGDH